MRVIVRMKTKMMRVEAWVASISGIFGPDCTTKQGPENMRDLSIGFLIETMEMGYHF